MIEYLCVGLGFYSALAIINRKTFKDASVAEVVKGGVLGIVFWPLAAVYIYFVTEES